MDTKKDPLVLQKNVEILHSKNLGIADFYEYHFGPIKLSCIYVGHRDITGCT